MTIVDLLLLILVGGICGAIAEMVVGFSPGGFLGALLGTWLARQLHLPSIFAVTIAGYTIEILWAILGAIVLLLILSMFRRRRSYRRRYL